MATLAELKFVIRDVLQDAGIEPDEASAEAEMIIRHVTELNPSEQILFLEEVPEQWLNGVESIVSKRLQRVPIQYILQTANFRGLNFAVKPGVFIPRSDTEALVEAALLIIQESKTKAPRIADIGCGSGAIAISLAKALPKAKIFAIDISDVAMKIARANCERHGVSKQIEFIRGDWRKSLPLDLHLIVSNPPYIPRHKAKELLPEVVDNEPHLALFGGDPDGLGHYRDFARLSFRHFSSSGGFVCLEVGDDQADSVLKIFEKRGWINVRKTKDINGRERVVSAWSPKKIDVKKT